MVRFSTIPTSVKNYGLALMDISFIQYMICCVLGSLVFVPVQASAGKRRRMIAEHSWRGSQEVILGDEIFRTGGGQ